MKTPTTALLLALCAFLAPTITHSQDSARIDSALDRPTGDKAFTKVEVESTFPGGDNAWLHFLNAHLVYPAKAYRKGIQGTVILQFIVDKQGNISDLQAITGDPILRAAAVKAMANSPKWSPATLNGKPVKSYKKQPIVFKLE